MVYRFLNNKINNLMLNKASVNLPNGYFFLMVFHIALYLPYMNSTLVKNGNAKSSYGIMS